MRDKGADADHMRAEFCHKIQIVHEIVHCLERASHHHAAADLKADFPQISEAAHTVLNGQFPGMELTVVDGIDRLVAQKIAVCSRIEEGFIALPGPLAYGEGDSAVRMPLFDLRHKPADLFIREKKILAALQDKSAKSKYISLVAAVKDLFCRQPVPLRVFV